MTFLTLIESSPAEKAPVNLYVACTEEGCSALFYCTRLLCSSTVQVLWALGCIALSLATPGADSTRQRPTEKNVWKLGNRKYLPWGDT